VFVYVPSLVQAAAKAAKRHTANTRSAFDFMAVVLQESAAIHFASARAPDVQGGFSM
jgi:hypothetical protein